MTVRAGSSEKCCPRVPWLGAPGQGGHELLHFTQEDTDVMGRKPRKECWAQPGRWGVLGSGVRAHVQHWLLPRVTGVRVPLGSHIRELCVSSKGGKDLRLLPPDGSAFSWASVLPPPLTTWAAHTHTFPTPSA